MCVCTSVHLCSQTCSGFTALHACTSSKNKHTLIYKVFWVNRHGVVSLHRCTQVGIAQAAGHVCVCAYTYVLMYIRRIPIIKGQ